MVKLLEQIQYNTLSNLLHFPCTLSLKKFRDPAKRMTMMIQKSLGYEPLRQKHGKGLVIMQCSLAALHMKPPRPRHRECYHAAIKSNALVMPWLQQAIKMSIKQSLNVALMFLSEKQHGSVPHPCS